jgi:hypothetical protein
MTTKKKILLSVGGVAVCVIVYSMGYSSGRTDGFSSGYKTGVDQGHQDGAASAQQHHYEFKQNGVSIFRFDIDTGESCWLQLGPADAREEDHLTNPMQQCSK